MELKVSNSNYAASIVEVASLVAFPNCDNVQGAVCLGNVVVVSKETKIGDTGIYFPLESAISKEFLSANNLYRDKTLNKDTEKAGYFEKHGRVRAVPFRGNKSQGFFIPLSALSFEVSADELKVGMEFTSINGVEICSKYVPNTQRQQGNGIKPAKSSKPKVSKIIENQFRFHQDTSMLYKNLKRFTPDTIIHLSKKLHGTSGISAKLLCRKELSWKERVAKFFGFDIKEAAYDFIYSSRKVIKNDGKLHQHFYTEDIWGEAHKILEPFISDGLSLYYEIVGYTPNGQMIQKDYDYGFPIGKFGIFIYRITYTALNGNVIEFSPIAVADWCTQRGLNPVPQYFYGTVKEYLQGREDLLAAMVADFNDKDDDLCVNKVPEEGVVIRVEGVGFEAYKQKSYRFYERETKLADKGEVDIDTEQSNE